MQLPAGPARPPAEQTPHRLSSQSAVHAELCSPVPCSPVSTPPAPYTQRNLYLYLNLFSLSSFSLLACFALLALSLLLTRRVKTASLLSLQTWSDLIRSRVGFPHSHPHSLALPDPFLPTPPRIHTRTHTRGHRQTQSPVSQSCSSSCSSRQPWCGS